MLTEEDKKSGFVALTENQLEEVANACNRYPNLVFEVECETKDLQDDEEVVIKVSLTRDGCEEDTLEEVHTQYYNKVLIFDYLKTNKKKEENWWIVIGESSENKLHTIKRVNFVKDLEVSLKFDAPDIGKHELIVYLICDSYIGCDQEVFLFSYS